MEPHQQVCRASMLQDMRMREHFIPHTLTITVFTQFIHYRDRALQEEESSGSSRTSSQSQTSQQFSQNSQLEALAPALGQEVQQLMLATYRAIGDPDGVYGCGAGRRADPVAR